jgi:hypothetical protein
MGTLSEHTGNGTPTATSLLREETKEQIDGVLQHFDVLPSRFDRCIFKFIYVYLLGLFFLMELLLILFLLGIMRPGAVHVEGGLGAFAVVVLLFIIWPFNVWRLRTAKTLRDLLEQKHIYLPDGDANTSYLRFLKHYREALASPKRYFLSGLPMIVLGILIALGLVQILSVEHPNLLLTLLVVVAYLLAAFLYLGGLYCIGIVTWAVYISGCYVRKLVRAFELSIQPFHPDQCGGLKLLGNFCFGLVSPPLIGSGLLIGYILFALLEYAPSSENSATVYLAPNVGFPLLLLLLYALPVIILAFVLPLRDIHTKMVSEGETNENSYVARIQALREEIQSLLESNQVQEAKAVQEKKALVETLYTPYPTWPFRFRSKIFSTVLGVSGSLLLGLITAALQQYFLPAILQPLFHHP